MVADPASAAVVVAGAPAWPATAPSGAAVGSAARSSASVEGSLALIDAPTVSNFAVEPWRSVPIRATPTAIITTTAAATSQVGTRRPDRAGADG